MFHPLLNLHRSIDILIYRSSNHVGTNLDILKFAIQLLDGNLNLSLFQTFGSVHNHVHNLCEFAILLDTIMNLLKGHVRYTSVQHAGRARFIISPGNGRET
jgi:hypothetical protein